MRFGFGLALVVGAGAIYVYTHTSRPAEPIETQQNDEDEAVAMLPPGVEDEWTKYIDQQLGRAFELRDRSLAVDMTQEKSPAKRVIISLNSPYTIECSPSDGAVVRFGRGNEATVPIYGKVEIDMTRPPLGVSAYSVAAKNLTKDLCDRIDKAMTAIMKP